ncbi:hypothetical protein [Thiomicrorhabdus sp.]|uniref:hypothetical protein n=1 Tax=Thiomicrorhabdus sp. TaxID=2039724 RepID=UPI00356785CA
MRYLTLLLALIISSSAFSGPYSYACKIAGEYRVESKDGKLTTPKPNAKLYEGKDFNVDRKSGVVLGAIDNSSYEKKVVLDRGSKQQSFKLIWYSYTGFGAAANYLTIREYEESEKKPFSAIIDWEVLSGTCQ